MPTTSLLSLTYFFTEDMRRRQRQGAIERYREGRVRREKASCLSQVMQGPTLEAVKNMLSFLCDFPSGILGKSWTRRMSCRSCGQMLCLQRCGTGWLLPSLSRPGPKADEQRRNPSSEVLSMQCRLGSLWKGESWAPSVFLCLCLCPSFSATLDS